MQKCVCKVISPTETVHQHIGQMQLERRGCKRTIEVQDVCEVDASLPPCLLKSVHNLGLLAVGDLRARKVSQRLLIASNISIRAAASRRRCSYALTSLLQV